MKKISNVLFDLDGTLTDPGEGITKSIQFALGELGYEIPPAESLFWCVGPPLKLSFQRLLNSSDQAMINQAIARYRDRYAEVGLYENLLYPQIPEMLARAHELGVRAFIATSKPRVFALKILDYFQISPFFAKVYGSELNGTNAEKGQLIGHLLRTEAIDPATVLMVGDREHDIFGAHNNGIRSAAVTYGYGSRQELVDASPDYIFEQPLELMALLQ